MTAPQSLGLNLGTFANMPKLNLTFPTNPNDILSGIPETSNILVPEIAMIILFLFMILMFYILSDSSNFGRFKYSDLRSWIISTGLTTIMGLVGVQIKYFYDFKAVTFFGTLFAITYIIFLATESKT